MTFSTDASALIEFYWGKCCFPSLVEWTKNPSSLPPPYPDAIQNCPTMIYDFMSIMRSIVYNELESSAKQINGYYMADKTCGQYAHSVFYTVKTLLTRNHHVLCHVIRLDRCGKTVINKSAGAEQRYGKVRDATDYNRNILSVSTPFDDHSSMPAPLNSIFKSKKLRQLLYEYLIGYFMRNFGKYLDVNDPQSSRKQVIFDGFFMSPKFQQDIFQGRIRLPPHAYYNPLQLTLDSDGNMACQILDGQFCNMIGESDLGVLFWADILQTDCIIQSADGDMFLVLLMYLSKLKGQHRFEKSTTTGNGSSLPLRSGSHHGDDGDDDEQQRRRSFKIFLRRTRNTGEISHQVIKEYVRRTQGVDIELERNHITKTALYFDMEILYGEIISGEWLLEPGETMSQVLKKEPSVHPIELFAVLCFMDGNDFHRTFPLRRFSSIFKTFTANPSRYRQMVRIRSCGTPPPPPLSHGGRGSSLPLLEYGVVVETYLELFYYLHGPPKSKTFRPPPPPSNRRSPSTATSSSANATKKKASSSSSKEIPYSREALACVLEEWTAKNRGKKPPESYIPIEYTLESLYASAANAAWNLAYFGNGHFHQSVHQVADPMATERNGKSSHGWEYVNPTTNVQSQAPSSSSSSTINMERQSEDPLDSQKQIAKYSSSVNMNTTCFWCK